MIFQLYVRGFGRFIEDEVEAAIEAELEKDMETVPSDRLGKAERVDDADGRYIEFCKSTIPLSMSLKGLKLVVDCANGATYYVAPNVFTELGAEVVALATEPNGLNINKDCGSTRPSMLQAAVREQGAEVGLKLKLHADELAQIGATRLAGEVRAVSADHLETIDDAGIAAAVGAGAGLAVCAVNQMKKKRAQSNHETVTVDDFKEEA